MTKGDISGNGLIGAHFSCNSHGNIQFPAGKKCPSLHAPPRAEMTPATTISNAPGSPNSTEPQVVPIINHMEKRTWVKELYSSSPL